MEKDLVTIEVRDGVADVRLNRPDKYNALNPAMFQAIIDAGESLAASKEVRAVVLSGNGPGFCAGLDMGSFQGMSDSAESGSNSASGLLAKDERPENHAQRPAYVWKRLLEQTWHAEERAGLALEAKLQTELIGSPNQLEAIRANFEKRAPVFSNTNFDDHLNKG